MMSHWHLDNSNCGLCNDNSHKYIPSLHDYSWQDQDSNSCQEWAIGTIMPLLLADTTSVWPPTFRNLLTPCRKTSVSGHLLACGPITHLLAIVYMVFPSGSRMGSPEVFLGAFHPMHPLWDQWLVNITNYLKGRLTVDYEDCPQEHQVALASAPWIVVAGLLLEMVRAATAWVWMWKMFQWDL